MRPSRCLAFLCLAAIATGCGESKPRGQRATDVDPVTATPDYWWEKPAPAKVSLPDFDRAVAAVLDTMRANFFTVERMDLRAGIITSKPLIAAQWFEPWRQDNSTMTDVARSSMATYRRTIRFDITRTPEGRYLVTPRVLVERQTVVGHRVTGVLGFGGYTAQDESTLVARTEEGDAAATYWYATVRDYPLEVSLVEGVVSRAY